jgi:hypothetical protein
LKTRKHALTDMHIRIVRYKIIYTEAKSAAAGLASALPSCRTSSEVA